MKQSCTIGGVDLSKEIFIIAEVGNNHEGDASLALEMIELAAEAGAHAVKFQTIEPAKLVSPADTQRIAQLTRFQLSMDDYAKLARAAADKGLLFLSTPFYLDAVDFLDPLVPAFKISSGDNRFIPLLKKVAGTGKPVLLSCGLSDIDEVAQSMELIKADWAAAGLDSFIVLLHCVSCYPTPHHEANLKAITALGPLADVVGYSDHTLGPDAAVAAAALGARVIEKHFTLDKNHSEFRDHQLSADPIELKEICERVALVNAMLGDADKSPRQCESPLGTAARRSIAAARDLHAGSMLDEADIIWLRPGGGFAPGEEEKVLGRRLKQPLRAGDLLKADDFEA